MRGIILVASLLVVIELAGSSILDRVEQKRINTLKQCSVEVGSALYDELDEATNDLWFKCVLGKDYLHYDPITDRDTCKPNASDKCKASVQEVGRVYNKVWLSVPDPTICQMYEFVNTLVESCN